MNFDYITPSILLGQKIDTQGLNDALVKEGVTHVINLWSGLPEPIWTGSVLTLKQEDDGTPRPADQVQAAVKYASEVPAGQRLYVHCQWGLGRGPSTTYAILRSQGHSQLEATLLINIGRSKCKGYWEHYIPSIEEALNVTP